MKYVIRIYHELMHLSMKLLTLHESAHSCR